MPGLEDLPGLWVLLQVQQQALPQLRVQVGCRDAGA
jgi:hypothetical protein